MQETEADFSNTSSVVVPRLSTHLTLATIELKFALFAVNASMSRRWRRSRGKKLSLRMVCGIHAKYRDAFLC